MSKIYESNIVNDEKLTDEFNSLALTTIYSFKKKYYTVFSLMTEDDILGECWCKILSQDISYDTSKKTKFSTFVRMIVHSVIHDQWRKIRVKMLDKLDYLDKPLLSDDKEEFTEYDIIPDIDDSYTHIENLEFLKTFNNEVFDVPIYDILRMLYAGLSSSDIAEYLGIDKYDVRYLVRQMKDMIRSRYEGNDMRLDDILFKKGIGLYCDKKESMFSSLKFVKSGEGVKLSEIIKLVMKDLSYYEIGEKVGMSAKSVKEFLDKCVSITL